MATNLVTLAPPAAVGDVQTDIKNAVDGRERLRILLALLAVQRKDAENAFLKAFTADLAAVKGELDKAFADAQFTKFSAWKTADDELTKRITALQTIAGGLENRIDEFKAAYPLEVISLLTQRIEALRQLLLKQEFEEDALNLRIEALEAELDQLLPQSAAAKPAASAKKTKS